MIRFIHCMKRRSDVDASEFRRNWTSPEFLDITQRLMAILRPIRFKRSLVLAIDENQELMRKRGGTEAFDGILEAWFASGKVLQDLVANAEYQALMAEMEAFQARFVDFAHSARFITDWED